MERSEIVLQDGPWTPQEDENLISFVEEHGRTNWPDVPKFAGLERSWTSCKSRWIKLWPDYGGQKPITRNEKAILYIRCIFRDDWSNIASFSKAMTGDEIKHLWDTCVKEKFIRRKNVLRIMCPHLKKKLCQGSIDPKIPPILQRICKKMDLQQTLIQRGIDPVHHQNFSQGDSQGTTSTQSVDVASH